MTRSKDIVVVFEDGRMREESVMYAVGLSRRMNRRISFLMLMADSDRPTPPSRRSILGPAIDRVRREGVSVQGEVRCGDKASEFLKFLARKADPFTIVWGGDEALTTGKRCRRPRHWFARMAASVMCPIVTPTVRPCE